MPSSFSDSSLWHICGRHQSRMCESVPKRFQVSKTTIHLHIIMFKQSSDVILLPREFKLFNRMPIRILCRFKPSSMHPSLSHKPRVICFRSRQHVRSLMPEWFICRLQHQKMRWLVSRDHTSVRWQLHKWVCWYLPNHTWLLWFGQDWWK